MDKDLSRLLNPALQHIGAYKVEGGQQADVKLNQNESPFDLPVLMKEAILDEFKQEAWNRYPDILPFRGIQAYANFVGVPSESVMMSNGSNEMLYTIFLACLSKGRKVVIPIPSFSLYEKLAILLQSQVVAVPMHEDLAFDVPEIIRRARDEKAGFVVLSTPNNPTSRSLSLEEIRMIASEVDAIVLVDEAYVEFSREESAIALLEETPNLIVLRTMSKALALAGMRIGFAMANPELMAQIAKPKIPFTSSRLAEITLTHVLDNYHLVEEAVSYILNERVRMSEALRKINGIRVFESDANFIIIRVSDAQKVFSYLAGQGILVRNVSGYPLMENCLRFNIGLRQENDLLLEKLLALQ
ncbi:MULTISPECIES: histidinol-phosphate transaminase [Prosthecochloris]|uniref:Histidinol-phosphate aminotransferase n=1 Tax=Prosthecochloris marina TaxID=2017681 RepID=A0A317T9E4_9CHLB|nr:MULTISPECIES: histidinol-phosphate transaminase [Prosthecochloris]PWW83369.1 histidinol-phosphate transaminase [Prosthecochloris marina]UZJ36574.1 histidinol-phosphate transaminase [Prosthecochloris sp. SCSIO W1103]